jgi:DNA invertase Pin-like site-specific DNA recombinase
MGRIGYARVSTHEQTLDLQLDALVAAKCDRIFEDKVSGSKELRPGLEAAIDYLRPGDTLIVWRLDRLGRSLKHLLELVETFQARNIQLVSLHESIDTATSGGKLIFSVFGAIAEFERNLITERTLAGLAAAKARGRQGGRIQQHSAKKVEAVAQLSSQTSVAEACRTLGIGRSTYYRRKQNHDL